MGKVHHKRGRVYSCSKCQVTKERSRLITHYLSEHVEPENIPYSCRACGYVTGEFKSWQNHLSLSQHMKAIRKSASLEKDPKTFLIQGSKPVAVRVSADRSDPTAHIYELTKEESCKVREKHSREGSASRKATPMQKTPESPAKPLGNDVLSLLKQNMNDQLRCELQKLLWTKDDQTELEGAVISIAEVSRSTEETKDGPVIHTESEPKSESEDSEDDDGDSSANEEEVKSSVQTPSKQSEKSPRKRSSDSEWETSQEKRFKADPKTQEAQSLPSESPRNDAQIFGEIVVDDNINDLCHDSIRDISNKSKDPDLKNIVRDCVVAISEVISTKIANQPIPLQTVLSGISNHMIDINQNLGTLIGRMGSSTEDKSVSAFRTIARHIETMKTNVFTTSEDMQRCTKGLLDAIHATNTTNQNLRTAIQSLTTQIKIGNDLIATSLNNQTKEFRKLSHNIESLQQSLHLGGSLDHTAVKEILGSENGTSKKPDGKENKHEVYFTSSYRARHQQRHSNYRY